VAAGVGVALIPELALTSVREDIVVRDLVKPTPLRRVVAATSRSAGITPAASAMLELLQEVAADYTSG
jgi:DNA-binding transcriptional LysR family regulator